MTDRMMLVLYFTRTLNGLLMILLPIGWGLFIWKHYQTRWRYFWVGVGTMVLAQAGHIPFNALLTFLFQGVSCQSRGELGLAFNAVVLGLSAGVWEETFRYFAYRWWAKDARSYDKGLMMGAGHGGIEAIVLGVFVLYVFIQMVALRNMNLSATFTPERAAALQEQLKVYWSVPWYTTLAGALERFNALIFHLTASVLVLQVFLRKQMRWLWLAILWHAALDGLAVGLAPQGIPVVEAALVGFTLVNVCVLYALRRSGMETEAVEEADVSPAGMDLSNLVPGPDRRRTWMTADSAEINPLRRDHLLMFLNPGRVLFNLAHHKEHKAHKDFKKVRQLPWYLC